MLLYIFSLFYTVEALEVECRLWQLSMTGFQPGSSVVVSDLNTREIFYFVYFVFPF